MKGKQIPTSSGPLFIWQNPEPTEDYAIGADSSEGVKGSDPAAACVVRMRDGALVAVMTGLVSPPEWGRKVARLGWLYREALVAFETFPSAHGLSAARTAAAYGYTRLHMRVQRTTAAPDRTELLGWHTDVRTKEMMIDRVREALTDNYTLPCLDLLIQLRQLRYNDKHRLEHPAGGHDDLFVALAIALIVRDEAFSKQLVRQEKRRPQSIEEIEFERYEARLAAAEKPLERQDALCDGV